MLAQKNASPDLAVKDLAVARAFYEDTLGFSPVDEMEGEVVTYKSGDTFFNIYRSRYAGTNKANAVTWSVGDDLEGIVEALKAKGVKFEHYDDMPDMELKGDIHVSGGMKAAWFKDPDGNILNLFNG